MHSPRKSKRPGPLPFQKRMSIARSGRLLKASTATLDRIEADAEARAKAELLARQALTAAQRSIADLADTGDGDSGAAESIASHRWKQAAYVAPARAAVPPSADTCAEARSSLASLQGDPELATGAEGLAGVDEQNRLLAAVEARLAHEVRGLGLSFREFAFRTQAIREDIPDGAKFCKLVAGFFPLVAFQLADALLSETQVFTFQDDGAVYLKELGLEVKDFVRELELEGRKFLAVSFLDKRGRDVLDRPTDGDEL
ncbi:hypothetical protein [Delftia sp. 67-8]|uniref:hypothetical protein n=1 Tax=Delftia sp. 67-8 TaxID=1895749 RepID=UPI0004D6CD8B|nr:hypothetical protein [Delftia sp. 67-8]KEH09800.1 hypothetical protein GY14_10580 [Delftia tsuruhatensis]OJX11233.1 MAG: hypothetical protein BGO79_17170 [Delftia sp. 67-8]